MAPGILVIEPLLLEKVYLTNLKVSVPLRGFR